MPATTEAGPGWSQETRTQASRVSHMDLSTWAITCYSLLIPGKGVGALAGSCIGTRGETLFLSTGIYYYIQYEMQASQEAASPTIPQYPPPNRILLLLLFKAWLSDLVMVFILFESGPCFLIYEDKTRRLTVDAYKGRITKGYNDISCCLGAGAGQHRGISLAWEEVYSLCHPSSSYGACLASSAR